MKVLAISSLVLAATARVNAIADAVPRNETVGLFASSCLAPEYHFDFPGNDLESAPASSFDQCCDLCANVRRCNAYTWTNYNGGTCWLKASRLRSEWKGANADGSAHTVSAEMNRCSKPFRVDYDLIGTDIGSSEGGQVPESCCLRCIFLAYEGCHGFSWTNYNGGTCWFKNGVLTPVSKPGVLSYTFLF